MVETNRLRACLIRPWIEDFSAFDLWMRPLGLLRLATILRRLGLEVRLLDCLDRHGPLLEGLAPPPRHRLNAFDCGHLRQEEIEKPEVLSFIPRRYKRHGLPLERVERWLESEEPPDVVFVSCMATYWYTGTSRLCRLVKAYWPDVPIVLGGIYPLLCPEHARSECEADVIADRPGWEAAISSAAPFLGSPGEKSIEKACAEPIESAYDLLSSNRSLPLLTRSGCPFRCTYCASGELTPQSVAFPPDWVVDELARALPKEGVTDVAFFDDALLMNSSRHSKPLFETLAQRELPVRFHTPNALHIRQIDREMATLLRRAGLHTVRLGLESDDPEFLSSSGGKVALGDFTVAMEYLKAAGFTAREVGTYVLTGLPGQSLEAVRRAALTVHQAGSGINLALYSPTPKTELFNNHQGFAFDPAQDPLLQNDSLTPWRSTQFTEAEFRELRHWVNRLNQPGRSG